MSIWVYSKICCYSLAVVATIIIVRFRTIIAHALQLTLFIFLGLVNEIISDVAAATIRNNAYNSNIYRLCEYLVLLWLFRYWAADKWTKTSYFILMLFGVAVWTFDNLFFHSISNHNDFSRLLMSSILLVLSVTQINAILATERKRLINNPQFLICVAMVIYFSYQSLIEVFYLFRPTYSIKFSRYLLAIYDGINLLANFLYAWAVLLIPKKERLTINHQLKLS